MHAKQMYYQALHAGQGKKVIITETGWCSQGTGTGDAQPSMDNALRYFEYSSNGRLRRHQVFYFPPLTKLGSRGRRRCKAPTLLWDAQRTSNSNIRLSQQIIL